MKTVVVLSLLLASVLSVPELELSKNANYMKQVKLVDAINNDAQSTFKAGHYERFSGLSVDELKKFTGLIIDMDGVRKYANDKSEQTDNFGDTQLPKNFSVWDKWPKCDTTFRTLQDQSNCGACYGVGIASALADRTCIQTGGKTTDQLSSWDFVSCCEDCKWKKSDGCAGGYADKTYKFYSKVGIVTGGGYNGGGCLPYPVKPNTRDSTPATTCNKRCQSSYTANTYDKDKRKGGLYNLYINDEEGVKREIYNRGTITAGFLAFEDFMHYTSGVYKYDGRSDMVGGHLVRVVGWGETAGGTKYWQCINSWGKGWGEQGTFKFIRGEKGDRTQFQGMMIGGNVATKDLNDPDVGKDKEPDNKDNSLAGVGANANFMLVIAVAIKLIVN